MSEPFRLDAPPADPLSLARILETGGPAVDRYLGEEIYANTDAAYLARQRERLARTVHLHRERTGAAQCWLLRAPGRLNAFLEYLDMCRGDHMSTTIDGDIPAAVTPRTDGLLNVGNANDLFPPETVDIREEFRRFRDAPWAPYASEMEDNWDNRSLIYPHYGRLQGNWLNYVLSPYMRMQWEHPDLELRGADITFGPATAPFRAGTSSSSALVVLAFLALYLCNRDKLPEMRIGQVCRLLGEAEWYVGTHGGANDQMTILRNPVNSVLYNRHSRDDLATTPLPFVRGVHVVLANSLWEVNKTMGGNQSFNMRKGWIRMGDEVTRLIISAALKQVRAGGNSRPGWVGEMLESEFGLTPGGPTPLLDSHPDYWELLGERYREFGSLHTDILGIPTEAIDELISLLPVKLTPVEAGRILGRDPRTIERLYTAPRRQIGGYHLRTTARFFHRENQIGRKLEKIFLEAEERVASGKLSPESPEYDRYRVEVGRMLDEVQDALSFDFRVSIPQLDLLLTIARRGPGYLGGKLTGAGKGGCVSLLVRQECSQAMCEYLDREYYGRPERFEFYRQVLEDDRDNSEPGSPEYESAIERLKILEAALANIPEQRRVITFSRGACVLEMPGNA
ncbi:MAG: hypothetical protein KatS3mg024_2021 [Armatimonadota bacterium]|nr:MAG: hypothetical protein KatS3mg024_2021 [Armatimonadota bacterium]